MRRLRAGAAAVLAVLLGGCASTGDAQRVPTSTPGIAYASYRVTDGVGVHAWTRPGRTAAPWLVYVHGGSWYHGRGDSPRADEWARHEVPRGYQVFGIDYRLSTQARWPAQRTDVARAVEWVRARAGRFGLDPARAVIMGESAGGQLAAIEASRGRFVGAIDLAGVVDPPAALHAPDHGLGDAARRLVGCAPVDCPRRWHDTRAVAHAGPRTPPFLIVHTVGDRTVPVSMSRAFAVDLRAAGTPVSLHVVPGREHPPAIPATTATVDRFLDGVTR